jgi:hypothetical protein
MFNKLKKIISLVKYFSNNEEEYLSRIVKKKKITLPEKLVFRQIIEKRKLEKEAGGVYQSKTIVLLLMS